MKAEKIELPNGDLQIILTFDEHDQICLNHDLKDIFSWYSTGPAYEKILNCKKRMIKEYKEILLNAPEMQSKTLSEINEILQDDQKVCKLIKKLPIYKDRNQREV